MKPLRAATYASAPLLSLPLLSATLLSSGCSEGDLPPPISSAGTASAEAGSGGMPSGSGKR